MKESKFRKVLEDSNFRNMFEEFIEDESKRPLTLNQFNLTLELKEQFGGEGQGDTYWVVFSVTDHETKEETNYKLDGWYASYSGNEYSDYEDFYEVEEVEKTIQMWERVNAT